MANALESSPRRISPDQVLTAEELEAIGTILSILPGEDCPWVKYMLESPNWPPTGRSKKRGLNEPES